MNIFIGLGSNISPESNLKKAAAILHSHFPGIRFSSVYRTTAREVEDQDDFFNTVATFVTEQSPEVILSILQSIEQSLGKAPPYRFGPRTIDLDLLLYGDRIIPDEDAWKGSCQLSAVSFQLVIPHPRMHERRFVLEPLCELIEEDAVHPLLKKSWHTLLEQTLNQQCCRTDICL